MATPASFSSCWKPLRKRPALPMYGVISSPASFYATGNIADASHLSYNDMKVGFKTFRAFLPVPHLAFESTCIPAEEHEWFLRPVLLTNLPIFSVFLYHLRWWRFRDFPAYGVIRMLKGTMCFCQQPDRYFIDWNVTFSISSTAVLALKWWFVVVHNSERQDFLARPTFENFHFPVSILFQADNRDNLLSWCPVLLNTLDFPLCISIWFVLLYFNFCLVFGLFCFGSDFFGFFCEVSFFLWFGFRFLWRQTLLFPVF